LSKSSRALPRFVRDTNFPGSNATRNSSTETRKVKRGVAGYEIALNFNGLPFELTPRAASEIKARGKFQPS